MKSVKSYLITMSTGYDFDAEQPTGFEPVATTSDWEKWVLENEPESYIEVWESNGGTLQKILSYEDYTEEVRDRGFAVIRRPIDECKRDGFISITNEGIEIIARFPNHDNEYWAERAMGWLEDNNIKLPLDILEYGNGETNNGCPGFSFDSGMYHYCIGIYSWGKFFID